MSLNIFILKQKKVIVNFIKLKIDKFAIQIDNIIFYIPDKFL